LKAVIHIFELHTTDLNLTLVAFSCQQDSGKPKVHVRSYVSTAGQKVWVWTPVPASFCYSAKGHVQIIG
jgi:hypothetical protein